MIKMALSFCQCSKIWLLMLVFTLSMMATALYFQYVLEEPPCALCIHVRLLVAFMFMVSTVALLLGRNKWVNIALHLLNTGLIIVFIDRAWQLLGVERGFIMSECGYTLGLPEWFAIDSWFPAIFEVQALCGYTPYVVAEISMAEILIVISPLLLLVSLFSLVSVILKKQTHAS